jgi:tRNA A37 threonylcarbamoyladenosine modification protein TsaB
MPKEPILHPVNEAARLLGYRGGIVRSEAKTRAARENAKKAGRPKLYVAIFGTHEDKFFAHSERFFSHEDAEDWLKAYRNNVVGAGWKLDDEYNGEVVSGTEANRRGCY